jgi:REP element-mobilizing transposase RayT
MTISDRTNNQTPHQRHHPRLKDRSIYQKPGSIGHIIIGTKDRYPLFENEANASEFKDITIRTSQETQCPLYAYCIMPDHIHLLIGAVEGTGIVEFIKILKGRFAVFCRKTGLRSGLQKSFYDHMIRKDEDLRTVAEYILGNPVRSGITKRIGEYPFAGSLVFNL